MPQVSELSTLPVLRGNPAVTDYLIGVIGISRGQPTAMLVPVATVESGIGGGVVVGGTTITGGSTNQLLYDNAGKVGELSLGIGLTINAGSLIATGEITIGSSPILSGTTGRLLYDNAGVIGEAVVGSGLTLSGGTLSNTGVSAPGGTATQLQYNNSGAFGGIAGSAVSANGSVTLGGATVTTSDPVLNLSQTWNAGAVAFTALKLNVTNTASAAGSLLLDLQVGGSSLFNVDKSGNVLLGGSNISVSVPSFNPLIKFNTSSGTLDLNINGGDVTSGGNIVINVSKALAWNSNDTTMWRQAAQTVALASGATASAFRVYNTTDSNTAPTNYERLVLDWTTTANVATIGTFAGGTGTARDLHIVSNFASAPFLIRGDTLTGNGIAVRNVADTQFAQIRGSLVTGAGFFTAGDTAGGLVTIHETNNLITLQGAVWRGTPGIWMNSATPLGWASTTDADAGTKDTTLSRAAASVVQFGNGSTANANGGWLAATSTIAQGTNATNFAGLAVTATWNSLATTGASGTGTTATLTFATQLYAFPVGTTITVAGVTPTGYNGTFTVTASTTTSVSYANATTGAQTVAGTITTLYDAPIKLNVTNTASVAGSLLMDLQVGGGTLFGMALPGGSTTNFSFGGTYLANNTFNIQSLFQGATLTVVDNANRYTFQMQSGGVSTAWALNARSIFGWSSADSVNSLTSDTTLYRDAAVGVLALANNTTLTAATGLRVYNTTDHVGGNAAPTNYERGVFDWTTQANTLTIGTQLGGTGSARAVQILSQGNIFLCPANTPGSSNIVVSVNESAFLNAGSNYSVVSNSFVADGNAATVTLSGASKVLNIGSGLNNTTDHSAWFNYGGQARVTSAFSITSSVTLANVTGLTVNVQAGRTYNFEACLILTSSATAGGIQAAISGTATATSILYAGWTMDSGSTNIHGYSTATALGTAVGSASGAGVTSTTLTTFIYGSITVNAAGTLTVQAAQGTSSATATVIGAGSYFRVFDTP